MAALAQTDIVLYDLACIKDVCFSPVVWRVRMMLNYKRIPYQTVFLEFPDIEPTLKELGVAVSDTGSASAPKYTVPTIHHIPTGKYIMNSQDIAEFLESTYPALPVTLTSELGREIETKSRSAIAPTFGVSVMPREINILLPRSQEYFRRSREAALGHPLEDLLAGDKEEKAWEAVADKRRAVGELLLTNKADGPFILGAKPSYTDFFIAGSLQSARMVDEGVFQRCLNVPGYEEIYNACVPFMKKRT